jgi:hypothetical protein
VLYPAVGADRLPSEALKHPTHLKSPSFVRHRGRLTFMLRHYNAVIARACAIKPTRHSATSTLLPHTTKRTLAHEAQRVQGHTSGSICGRMQLVMASHRRVLSVYDAKGTMLICAVLLLLVAPCLTGELVCCAAPPSQIIHSLPFAASLTVSLSANLSLSARPSAPLKGLAPQQVHSWRIDKASTCRWPSFLSCIISPLCRWHSDSLAGTQHTFTFTFTCVVAKGGAEPIYE